MSSVLRLSILQRHLSAPNESLSAYRRRSVAFNQEILFQEYMGTHADLIRTLRKQSADNPLFDHTKLILSTQEELHQRVYNQVKAFYSLAPLDYEQDLNDPSKKLTILQVLSEFDIADSTRYIVHLSLFIDIMQNIGTAKHRKHIDRAYKLLDYGCFAMTELGHGSNVAGLETTATFDYSTKEFVIHTPTKIAAKWWIGAAAKTANMAVVWAQLIVAEERKGIHAFIIEIRDFETHLAKKGVTIGDCGEKSGLNGIDNGFIIFNNYRVPYDALLDKLSQINTEGKYKSSIKSPEKRLGLMLAGLLRGRFAVVDGSEICLRNALTAALRYSVIRKQFGTPEKSIMDYQLHRSRLIPYLAKLFAIRTGGLYLKKCYAEINKKILDDMECDELAELHSVLSAFKAICSEYSIKGIQECREACGGLGYYSMSGFARLRSSVDVMLTWEGDNNVLIQQTSKYILKHVQKLYNGAKNTSPTLNFIKLNSQPLEWPLKSAADFTQDNFNRINEFYICLLIKQTLFKMQENSTKYDDQVEVWNNTQVDHANCLARAYGEDLLAKKLFELSEKISVKCKVTGELIKKISEVYVLDCWEKKQRIYVELKCTPESSKIIRDRYNDLCAELGESALLIVETLASSDRFLGSVLGHSDGNVYERIFDYVNKVPNVYARPTWFEDIKAHRKIVS